ncbi:hypothetical protein J2W46_006580 [Paraburkholderia strydomiana]|nr:hypothetical protein [Paraburkholderia strydomiana]
MLNESHEGDRNRWHVLTACFLAYTFDATDFVLLAMAMPVVIREFPPPLARAGLIGTATLIGAAPGVSHWRPCSRLHWP